MAVTVHSLPSCVQAVSPPEQFTYPFCYEPQPLCIAAANEVRRYLSQHPEWHDELSKGKMFGVLVVNGLSFLAAFSGTLDGKTQHDYFVPPVFDLMAPGCYFQEEEAAISAINRQIIQNSSQSSGAGGTKFKIQNDVLRAKMQEELAAFKQLMQQHKAERDALRHRLPADDLIKQSQHEKAEYRRLKQAWEQRIFEEEAPLREQQQQIELLQTERHERSIALQQWLFRQFVFLNALGEEKTLPELSLPQLCRLRERASAVRRGFCRLPIRKDCDRSVWLSSGWATRQRTRCGTTDTSIQPATANAVPSFAICSEDLTLSRIPCLPTKKGSSLNYTLYIIIRRWLL